MRERKEMLPSKQKKMEQRSPPEKIHVVPRTNQVYCKLTKNLLKPCQICEIIGAVKRKQVFINKEKPKKLDLFSYYPNRMARVYIVS